MSSAVSPSQVTSSTPILVTTPTSDTKSFNEHKRDESNDDQRQQLNKQLNKTYTRVCHISLMKKIKKNIYFLSILVKYSKKKIFIHIFIIYRATVIKINS